MEAIYPPGPESVPPDLTAATAAYKRHAWFAMLGLGAFIALYFALSGWFAWTAWRLVSRIGHAGDSALWIMIAAVCAAFLAVFMLKALFFVQHRYDIEDLEITREEQPRLFEFIDRLADEARAPRAHKVYLSPDVNAAVFYDLSLLNLVVPSKKNLKIGLGLVNVVTLGEFKAVLAHEFGHFAQRSMAVGRWVYISQQIAGHIVARRDILDKLLRQLSRLDLRIAWVGWLLSLTVWSIRSLMDLLFRIVLIAQRALSRQMEFQADLVAVSLTGSDALIHALHRLAAAEDAWDKTLGFARGEVANKRSVADLFAVQIRIIERMREILNQPHYGGVPPLPDSGRDAHRVFHTALAQPPRMWLTHPPSSDRESNAKRHYIGAPLDERSGWELFNDAPALRARMSAHVQRSAPESVAVPLADSLDGLDRQYADAFLDRRYRGTYLSRSIVRGVCTVDELYGVAPANLAAALDSLYPESLAGEMEQLTELLEEKAALQALRDQVAVAPGGIIRHRGSEIPRAQLPRVITELEAEITQVRAKIEAHDQLCRTAHLAAAKVLGKGWDHYLRGLAGALHYADHSEANLRDAQGLVSNVYSVVTADGRVSGRELTRLVVACEHLHGVLHGLYQQAAAVILDRTLLRRLEAQNWVGALGELSLPAPDKENIGNWLGVIDSWIGAAGGALGALRRAALEQLLLTETQVAKFARDGVAVADAPPASTLPAQYLTLLPGTERQRQTRLDWWDRFQTATGLLPAIARLVVAGGIVGTVITVAANMH
jgi:Zn-dependent protease with chaperone function